MSNWTYRTAPAIVVAALLIVVPYLHSRRTLPISEAPKHPTRAAMIGLQSAAHAATAADRAALAIRIEAQDGALLRAAWLPIVIIEALPAPIK